jgi:hypothetical protein
MLKIPHDETILYQKALSKEEFMESTKEINKTKKKGKTALQILLALLPVGIGVLALMPIGSPVKEMLTAVIVPAVGIFALVYSVLATPMVPKEYALGGNAVYLSKKEVSWGKLELMSVAVRLSEKGLLLEPEKKHHRSIFLFTLEVKLVERIIRSHIRVRY